jgi:hypothetical protein
MAISDTLIAAWEFQNVSDSHTSAKTLTNNNTATFTAGHVGNAATLVAASSQYFSRAGVTPPGAMTVAAMVKPIDTATAILMAQYDASVNHSFQIFQFGGNWYFRIHEGSDNVNPIWTGRSTTGGDKVTTGGYQAMVFTWAGGSSPSNAKIYKDNVQIDAAVTTSGSFAAQNVASQALSIGAQFDVGSPQLFWNGQIDNLFWFSSVLSSDELTWLYNGGAWRTYAEVLATTVATPTIDPVAGEFFVPFDITLTCVTPDSTIYYTLDGSTPDNTDTPYTAPFSLTAAGTVKAIAYATGLDTSGVASSTWTVGVVHGPREIRHADIKGNLIHKTFNFMQPTDPEGNVGVTLRDTDTWLDTSTDHLKFRNDTNDGWETI